MVLLAEIRPRYDYTCERRALPLQAVTQGFIKSDTGEVAEIFIRFMAVYDSHVSFIGCLVLYGMSDVM